MSSENITTENLTTLPPEILVEILKYVDPAQQIVFNQVDPKNQTFRQARDLVKPAKAIAELHFPDEVQFIEGFQKTTLPEEMYQNLYIRFSKRAFYFDTKSIYQKLIEQSVFNGVIHLIKPRRTVRLFYKWVKENNWNEINQLAVDKAHLLFTSYMDYKGRTALNWAHQDILNRFYPKLSSEKQAKISFKIMYRQLNPENIPIDIGTLQDYYPLVIRYGSPQLVRAWTIELKKRNLRIDSVSLWQQTRMHMLGPSESMIGVYTLRYAAQCGQLEIFEILYDEIYKNTPTTQNLIQILHMSLLEAVSYGHYNIVNFILNLNIGIDINHRFSGGKTFLHYAGEKRNLEMMRLLIRRGAKYTKMDIPECEKYPGEAPFKAAFIDFDSPEFEELNHREIIKSKLRAVLKHGPQYSSSEYKNKSEFYRAQTIFLLTWYKRQSRVTILDPANESWLVFHKFHYKSFVKTIIDKLENSQESFEKISKDYIGKKNGHFEIMKELIIEELNDKNENTTAHETHSNSDPTPDKGKEIVCQPQNK